MPRATQAVPTSTGANRLRQAGSTAAAAIASAATHAPENAAYGLIAFAALGSAFGPVAMGLALLGAAVGSIAASLVGAGRLADDAGAALALLTAGLVAALLPHVQGSGTEAGWQVLMLVALGVAATGVLVMLSGLLHLGAIVKFTPYPVHVGLSTGIGLLLVVGAVPALLGGSFGSVGGALRPGAVLVGLTALGLTWWAAHRPSRLPSLLLGLAAATLLQLVLQQLGLGHRLGPAVGVPALPEHWFGGIDAAARLPQLLAQPAVWTLLGVFALTASLIVTLDALLAASIVDGRLRRSRNANRELVAQGLANLASAMVGGLPASPSVPASVGLIRQRPGDRHIVLAYAAALLTLLLLAPAVFEALPIAAVGGVLVYLGLSMMSPTLWQLPLQAWRARHRRDTHAGPRRRHHLAWNWVVTVAVALSALLFGLGHAVLIGATVSVLLFVRANMRDVVRRVWRGNTRHSLKSRPPNQTASLSHAGHGIAVLELQGALFFGTADALRERLHALSSEVDTAILDMHQVGEIDVTGARILCEVAEDWHRQGKRLVFAEWARGDARRALMESIAGMPDLQTLHFAANTDLALEQAEDDLLQRLQVERATDAPLPLADTMIARELTPDELALLQAEMSPCEFVPGQWLFRAGDPGDALYISLKGDIGLRLPGTSRRLASFAPGVTIGEMAVLGRERRSADAVAESAVSALRLPVDSLDRLMRSHPALASKLLRNIALHLADRVRYLTTDLASWVSRAGADHPTARDGED